MPEGVGASLPGPFSKGAFVTAKRLQHVQALLAGSSKTSNNDICRCPCPINAARPFSRYFYMENDKFCPLVFKAISHLE